MNCSVEGCDEPGFDQALIDEAWYCIEHYPDASRYDTAVETGSVLCEVCFELRPGITYFGSIRQWRCRDHHPELLPDRVVPVATDTTTLEEVRAYLHDCWELL